MIKEVILATSPSPSVNRAVILTDFCSAISQVSLALGGLGGSSKSRGKPQSGAKQGQECLMCWVYNFSSCKNQTPRELTSRFHASVLRDVGESLGSRQEFDFVTAFCVTLNSVIHGTQFKKLCWVL